MNSYILQANSVTYCRNIWSWWKYYCIFVVQDFFSIAGKVGKNSNRKILRIIKKASSSDSKYFKISSGVTVAQFRWEISRTYETDACFNRIFAKTWWIVWWQLFLFACLGRVVLGTVLLIVLLLLIPSVLVCQQIWLIAFLFDSITTGLFWFCKLFCIISHIAYILFFADTTNQYNKTCIGSLHIRLWVILICNWAEGN